MNCKYIDFGTYECAVTVKGIPCDKCLSDEVLSLNSMGIKTTGSCCGHSRVQAYIQVDDDSVQKMHDLGYEAIPIDKFGNGSNAFIPKSNLEVEE